MEDVVLRITEEGGRFKSLEERLTSTSPQCLANDSSNESIVYCGTLENGLWKSEDVGSTWKKVDLGVESQSVTSLAVSNLERPNGFGVVYVGMEPSMILKSKDGGSSWENKESLTKLPSSKNWSFPPRPYTNHVRFIALDPDQAGKLYVAIEAGALVRSFDGGTTWSDRVVSGPYDTHTLATHKRAPGRLYSSAGDGYFESLDGGDNWKRNVDGLGVHQYLYGIAVDPNEPDTIIVSASSGPWRAHSQSDAESVIYRRSVGEKEWTPLGSGLPEPEGTIVSILAGGPSGGGEFYAANNKGIYRSNDSGLSWVRQSIPWKDSYLSQHAWSICVIETS